METMLEKLNQMIQVNQDIQAPAKKWQNVFYTTLGGLDLRLQFAGKQIKDPVRSEWKTIL